MSAHTDRRRPLRFAIGTSALNKCRRIALSAFAAFLAERFGALSC